MATQTPQQADNTEFGTTEASVDVEMAEATGDIEMTEESDNLETTAFFEVGSATDGRAYFASIFEDPSARDVQHGMIGGCFYSSRIELFIEYPESDERCLVSAKGEVDSFFTQILEELQWVPRSEQSSFPVTDLLLLKPDETFLRVTLVIADLEDEECSNIKYTLRSTPIDVYATCDGILHSILDGINYKCRRNSTSILNWLAFAKGPLSVDVLAVVSTETRRRRQSRPNVEVIKDLIEIWKPFLVLHEDKVFFVHEKAKEYMKERGLAAQWLVDLAGGRAKRRRLE